MPFQSWSEDLSLICSHNAQNVILNFVDLFRKRVKVQKTDTIGLRTKKLLNIDFFPDWEGMEISRESKRFGQSALWAAWNAIFTRNKKKKKGVECNMCAQVKWLKRSNGCQGFDCPYRLLLVRPIPKECLQQNDEVFFGRVFQRGKHCHPFIPAAKKVGDTPKNWSRANCWSHFIILRFYNVRPLGVCIVKIRTDIKEK